MRQRAGSRSDAQPLAVAPVGPLIPERDRIEPDNASPVVDLRVVLFTVAAGRLWVALHPGAAARLPVGTPTPLRPLDAEARRIARGVTGGPEQYLEQLYTLGVPDASIWTVIVGYLGLVGSSGDGPPAIAGDWHDVDRLPSLDQADRMMIDYALLRLRAKLGYTTIAFHLLPATFTVAELQGAYEAILGRRLDKRNFRRRVIAAGLLEPTGEQRRDGSHRPASLYRFPATADRDTYLTPPWAESA